MLILKVALDLRAMEGFFREGRRRRAILGTALPLHNKGKLYTIGMLNICNAERSNEITFFLAKRQIGILNQCNE